MFTGLVGPLATVVEKKGSKEMNFTLATTWEPDTYEKGESIACDGACMTVVDWSEHAMGSRFRFVASAESLSRTTLGNWKIGRKVNLERSLKVGDSLGGHLVAGHVDDRAKLVQRVQEHGSLRLTFEVAETFMALVAPKGSVAINGVSLTVNEVGTTRFGVNLVPHTCDHTNLGALELGDDVNFEADMLARYVARHIEAGTG